MSKIKCEQCDEMRVGRCYSAECPVELQIAANSHATLAAENAALKALVAEMVEGLKPFADEAEDWTYEATGEIYADATPIDGENRLRVGHMRQAYALITRAKGAVS